MVYSRPETDAWITDVRPHVWPMRKLFQGLKSLLYLDSDCLSWLQTTSLALIDPQGPAWSLVSNSNPLLSLMFILEKSFLDLFQWAKWNQSAYPALSLMSFAIQFHVILPLMAPILPPSSCPQAYQSKNSLFHSSGLFLFPCTPNER